MTREISSSTAPAGDVIPSVMALKHLLHKTADTGCEQVIRWHSLYCVATMLDAMYMDRYFDADKKQGLREMLQTLLEKMEMDTVTVGTEEERPRADRAETSLLDMYNQILVENKTTEQRNSTASK
jgi:hypothetical protein